MLGTNGPVAAQQGPELAELGLLMVGCRDRSIALFFRPHGRNTGGLIYACKNEGIVVVPRIGVNFSITQVHPKPNLLF